MNKAGQFVFLVGSSRTGSRYYLQVLNSHKDIHINEELMFRQPFKRTVYTEWRRFNNKHHFETIDYYNWLKGLHLKDTYDSCIANIDRASLNSRMAKLKNPNIFDLFRIVLEESRNGKNATILGAKFAFSSLYISSFSAEIDGLKLLYLVRDPRAIYVSDYRKKLREKELGLNLIHIPKKILRFLIFIKTVAVFKMNHIFVMNFAKKFPDNVLTLEYEASVSNGHELTLRLAEYLKVPNFFKVKTAIINSSFENAKDIDRWRPFITKFESKLLCILLRRQMKQLGYLK